MKNAITKLHVDESDSFTKSVSENETDPTLPNPEGEPHSNPPEEGLLDGSVMWDGPEPLGEGARSAVPSIPEQTTIDIAGGVTEPGPAVPASGSGATLAHPDAQELQPLKSQTVQEDSLTMAKPKRNVSDMSANDDAFVIALDSENEKDRDRKELVKHPGLTKWADHQIRIGQDLVDPEAPKDPDIEAIDELIDKVELGPRKSLDEAGNADRNLSEEDRKKGFALVQSARAVLQEIDKTRAQRMDTEPSAATIRDYE